MLTMVAFMFMMVFSGGGSNPWMVLPMVLMVLSSGGIAVYSYIKEKRDRAAAEAAYNERLVEMNRDMHNYHDQQRRFYTYNYPDRAATTRIVRDARWEVEKGERTLRGNTRLWERRTTDEDFGVVRLGMGTLPSTVTYVLKSTEQQDDPLTRAALKLQEDSRFVDEIPVIISLAAAQEGAERRRARQTAGRGREGRGRTSAAHPGHPRAGHCRRPEVGLRVRPLLAGALHGIPCADGRPALCAGRPQGRVGVGRTVAALPRGREQPAHLLP